MISVKSFLSLKNISHEDDLAIGEIGILNNKIIIKTFDNNVKHISFFEKDNIEFIIYGIRIPIKENTSDMTDETIERVLIKRHVYIDGTIEDNEFTSSEDLYLDGKQLSFSISDGVINNNAFDMLHPFSKMETAFKKIQPTADNISCDLFFNRYYENIGAEPCDIKFTSLPIFFKNKVKQRTVNNIDYDYYLISDVLFEDFYPVESHLMDNGKYAEKIWIESDWNIHCLKLIEDLNVVDSNFFKGDYILDAETNQKPTYIINQLIWFDYLYYVYMIKCATFKPIIKNLEEENNPIKKSSVFLYKNSDGKYCTDGGEITIDGLTTPLTFTLSSFYNEDKLSIGVEPDQMQYIQKIKDLIKEDLNYCLLLKDNGDDTVHCFYGRAIFDDNQSKFVFIESTKNVGSDYIISDIEYLDLLCIKSIPFFRWQTHRTTDDRYSDFFIKSIENNKYYNNCTFCIDNLMNIFPVFFDVGVFNSYFDGNNYEFNYDIYPGSSAYDRNEIIKYILNNYRTYIDSGTHSSWLNESTSKYHNILTYVMPNTIYPYFNGTFSSVQKEQYELNNTDIEVESIDGIVNFKNPNVKQIIIKSDGWINTSSLNNMNYVSRGNVGGKIYTNIERGHDSSYSDEYEFFTGIYTESTVNFEATNTTLNNRPIEFGWSNFTLYQKTASTNTQVTEKNIYDNWHCVTRLMYFE